MPHPDRPAAAAAAAAAAAVAVAVAVAVEPLESRRLFAAAPPVVGVGVLGDSFADEYQFQSDDRAGARNFVEQLAEDRGVNFGGFDPDPAARGEPRGAGFAYNWAKDGATTSDLIAQGQHTGLAAQVAAGEVNYAWVFAGGNDVLGLATSDDPAADIAALGATLLANGQTTLATLVAADPDVRVVVATVPRLGALPAVRGAVAAGLVPQAQVDAADAAIDQVNAQVRRIAKAERQVAVADVATLVQQVFARKRYRVGRVTLDRETGSNDPRSLFLADGVHAGTIGHGLLANVFVKAMRKEFKAKLKPLSTREILANAGLQPNGQPLVSTAVPAGAAAAAAGAAAR